MELRVVLRWVKKDMDVVWFLQQYLQSHINTSSIQLDTTHYVS